MNREWIITAAIALASLNAAIPARAADDTAPYHALRDLDKRLLDIGERLAVANAPWCRTRELRTGLLLHDARQYPAAGRAAFPFESEIEVEAVADGSMADRAGLMAGDGLLAIDGRSIGSFKASNKKQDHLRLDRIRGALAAALKPGPPVPLRIIRDGAEREVTLTGEAGCASVFRIVTDKGKSAGADGHFVSVGTQMAEWAESDDALAAIVAHEFAHNILEHRKRLDALGVSNGLLTQFGIGKSDRRIRMTEEEADRLSVWLLANAGYDIDKALAAWKRFGDDFGGLRAPTHFRSSTRIAMMTEEKAAIDTLRDAGATGALPPPLLTAPFASLE